jgi:hypothetical protein
VDKSWAVWSIVSIALWNEVTIPRSSPPPHREESLRGEVQSMEALALSVLSGTMYSGTELMERLTAEGYRDVGREPDRVSRSQALPRRELGTISRKVPGASRAVASRSAGMSTVARKSVAAITKRRVVVAGSNVAPPP